MDLAVAPQAPSRTEQWLRNVQAQVEDELARLLLIRDEQTLDSRWADGFAQTREYALRPGKRLRPALVLAGYALGGRDAATEPGVWRFAAATELLHTFLLIHDDVADRADLRRGGPALHRMLAPARGGEDLAVVAGDHLFARAVEGMLESGLPGAAAATRYYLGVCRHTAVGQYLDLSLSSARLSEVTLFQTLKVATLKTARYGFCAPLVCGAMLAGAGPELLEPLERAGRQLGVAYQLRDDVIGLFGNPAVSGKPADSDFFEGKVTFPAVAAYLRAGEEARAELDALWALPRAEKTPAALARARNLVERLGGLSATQRVISRASRSARRALLTLPEAGGVRRMLERLVEQLAHRAA